MAFHLNPWLLTNVLAGTSWGLKKLVSYGKNIYNFFFERVGPLQPLRKKSIQKQKLYIVQKYLFSSVTGKFVTFYGLGTKKIYQAYKKIFSTENIEYI